MDKPAKQYVSVVSQFAEATATQELREEINVVNVCIPGLELRSAIDYEFQLHGVKLRQYSPEIASEVKASLESWGVDARHIDAAVMAMLDKLQTLQLADILAERIQIKL